MRSVMQKTPATQAKVGPDRARGTQVSETSPVRQLQRKLGNQGLQRLLQMRRDTANHSKSGSAGKSDTTQLDAKRAHDHAIAKGALDSRSFDRTGIEIMGFTGRTDGHETLGKESARPLSVGKSRAAATDAFMATSLTSEKAPDGSPDNRTQVGVCESIEFSVSDAKANWTAAGGEPLSSVEKKYFFWRAPEQEGVFDITATIPGSDEKSVISMKVVAPNEIEMQKIIDYFPYLDSEAGAGMLLQATFHPLNVSFSQIKWREEGSDATDVDGYFAQKEFTGKLKHQPNPKPEKIGKDNTHSDRAATWMILKGPWVKGQFSWIIPNWYSCSTAEHKLPTTVQKFSIDETGQVTLEKQGAIVKRTPKSPQR